RGRRRSEGDWSDLKLDALQCLSQVRVARGVDMRSKRLERVVETKVVLIERLEAPHQRALKRGHLDVEEYAVPVEPESTHMRVLRAFVDERLRPHGGLHALAYHGRTVLDSTF